MLLDPLRRKRDELASIVKRTSDIPNKVIEEICCGGTPDYVDDEQGVITDGRLDYKVPMAWNDFILACDAVRLNELNEYSSTR